MSIELSAYITAPTLAWVVAQTYKYVEQSLRARTFKSASLLYKSGNMPSSHAALMLALLTVIAVKDGMGSAVFGVALALTMIVLYDAVNVRRSTGEQGQLLQKIAKKVDMQPTFYMAMGHRLSEVIVGSLLGIVSGVVVLQFM